MSCVGRGVWRRGWWAVPQSPGGQLEGQKEHPSSVGSGEPGQEAQRRHQWAWLSPREALSPFLGLGGGWPK